MREACARFRRCAPIGAVTRAMSGLAAPVPINNQSLYRARKRGCLPCWTDQTPPLLWQLVGTRRLRRHVHSYTYWRPPAHRPFAAWPLVGQIVTTVGLTVLTQAGMKMWASSAIWVLSNPVTNSSSGTFSPTLADHDGHCAMHMGIDP